MLRALGHGPGSQVPMFPTGCYPWPSYAGADKIIRGGSKSTACLITRFQNRPYTCASKVEQLSGAACSSRNVSRFDTNPEQMAQQVRLDLIGASIQVDPLDSSYAHGTKRHTLDCFIVSDVMSHALRKHHVCTGLEFEFSLRRVVHLGTNEHIHDRLVPTLVPYEQLPLAAATGPVPEPPDGFGLESILFAIAGEPQ